MQRVTTVTAYSFPKFLYFPKKTPKKTRVVSCKRNYQLKKDRTNHVVCGAHLSTKYQRPLRASPQLTGSQFDRFEFEFVVHNSAVTLIRKFNRVGSLNSLFDSLDLRYEFDQFGILIRAYNLI